jgi:hypothetical protein
VRDSGFAFVFRAVDFQPIGGAEGNVFQIQRKATFLRGWNIPARNAASNTIPAVRPDAGKA